MSEEHHILIGDDINCPAVLSGCHRKVIRHTDAEIYTRKTIKNKPTGIWKTKRKPWKLHIIMHGGHQSFPGTLPADLAQSVHDSKMKDETGTKVRLDICYSGYNGLAEQLKERLKVKYNNSNCNIEVSGVIGMDALGWGTDFNWYGTRIVVSNQDINNPFVANRPMDKAIKLWEKQKKTDWYKIWIPILLAKQAKYDWSSEKLKKHVKIVHYWFKKTLSKFYEKMIEEDIRRIKAGESPLLINKINKVHKVYF